MLTPLLLFAALLPFTQDAAMDPATPTETWHELDGMPYVIVKPAGLDPTQPVPVLLALPPGAEDKGMVEAGLELYWRALAESGWVVVSPAPRADGGASASAGDGGRFAALLEEVAKRFVAEGGHPHLAGISNGGRGAFHLAGLTPEAFLSMTCLPGMPPEEAPDFERLASLPIALFAGGDDAGWVAAAEKATEALRARGGAISLTVVAGEGHVIGGDAAVPIFEHFRNLRARVHEEVAIRAAIAAELDDLHAAAAEADEVRYFDHFAPTARGPVFIGTDATERWTLAEFRNYAHPYFAAGKAWTYTPTSRHIELDPASPDVAWFDELLTHASYGRLRGSGVLVRREGRWRVAQYVLSFCVPNAVAGDVVERIEESLNEDGEPPTDSK
jgi:predicted esterase